VSKNLHIKISDFGTSRLNTEGLRASNRRMVGTVAYSAPETFKGNFTDKCDIYSLGMVIWEMIYRVCNGKYLHPFGEFQDVSIDLHIISKVLDDDKRPTIPVDCPAAWAEILRNCWDRDPNKRPTAKQLVEILEHVEVHGKRSRDGVSESSSSGYYD